MRPIEVLGRYVAAMRSGDREAGYGFHADGAAGHVPGRSGMAGLRRVVDDRIVEIRVFESDQYAVDAWFGGAV